jgi:hypothetical protein
LLCARDETGQRKAYIEDVNGLSTEKCLNFLLGLPRYTKLFGFSLGYDYTKILADLPNRLLYTLMRPELRRARPGAKSPMPRPVVWGPYKINLVGRRFSVRRGHRSVTVWDVFAFYQSKFVTALKAWKVGDSTELDAIEAMKEERANFDKLSLARIRDYCFEECHKLAILVRKLTNAHVDAGLELTSYHGAGSTATAILTQLGIKETITLGPAEMQHAIACAFFGGRFEHSAIGVIKGPVFGRDISSAYPYQTCFLPCLVHGRWSLTRDRKRLETARASLVHYRLYRPRHKQAWAPFPFREKDGTICFPESSAGGWVWGAEYRAGEAIFPNVQFQEAWVLESDCDCQPFAKIPHFYRERLRIGKEGAGIVLKLGPNSVYGKLAQSIGGKPPFQSWIWAGMITSGCRAQILELFAHHDDLSNILAIATDGVYTREDVRSPRPRDTGTDGCPDENGKVTHKPLGGWESERYDRGLFLHRPGIYFPNDPTPEELKKVRARGIGKASMLAAWGRIVEAWAARREDVSLPSLTRFVGAKTGVHYVASKRAHVRSADYGQWVERPITLDFDPLPKRARIERHGSWGMLTLRRMPRGQESAPYDRSIVSPEATELLRQKVEDAEQPDGGDLTDWGDALM